MSSQSEANDSGSDSSTKLSLKRKREDKALAELEVNVDAPEPPSKKALRRAKKQKTTKAPETSTSKTAVREPRDAFGEGEEEEETQANDTSTTAADPGAKPIRSEHGVWIGNLPWSATPVELRTFLTSHSAIDNASITRIHMPAPTNGERHNMHSQRQQRNQPQNKGFAYVDFTDAETVEAAISLSEGLLTGRRLLIKNAKSFAGRPEAGSGAVASPDGTGAAGDAKTNALAKGNPPSKRIFVGNLAFDCTREVLQEHFQKCGDVADVFVATFEDSGKCKGYGWVTFEDVESAEKAVRGWVHVGMEDGASEEESEEEEVSGDEKDEERKALKNPKKAKKPRLRKWWVNRIQGRQLRMEFAEDASVRYKKRYGKGAATSTKAVSDTTAPRGEKFEVTEEGGDNTSMVRSRSAQATEGPVTKTRPKAEFKPERKVDARTIKPGAALAGAPRLTGAIIASQGKKTVFT